MHFSPKGICAVAIDFDVKDDRVTNVKFTGGCDGNHKGIIALCEGMLVDEVISRLRGITCGMRSTSCPDQLAVALENYKNNQL